MRFDGDVHEVCDSYNGSETLNMVSGPWSAAAHNTSHSTQSKNVSGQLWGKSQFMDNCKQCP